jgi:hypothetical protein
MLRRYLAVMLAGAILAGCGGDGAGPAGPTTVTSGNPTTPATPPPIPALPPVPGSVLYQESFLVGRAEARMALISVPGPAR